MRSKKIVIITIIVMLLISTLSLNVVQAANKSFNATVTPETTTAKPGDIVTIELSISDIDQSSSGIDAVRGNISYDENIFESIDVQATLENWTATLNKEDGHDLKGNVVINTISNNRVKTSSTIARIKAKIKSNVIASKGVININDVYTSYGSENTDKISRTVTVNITSSNSQGQTTPTGGESNGQPTTQPTAQPTTQATTVNSNNKTASSTAATKTIPKAGITYWLGICLVIAIIEAINRYIKYRKINSDK